MNRATHRAGEHVWPRPQCFCEFSTGRALGMPLAAWSLSRLAGDPRPLSKTDPVSWQHAYGRHQRHRVDLKSIKPPTKSSLIAGHAVVSPARSCPIHGHAVVSLAASPEFGAALTQSLEHLRHVTARLTLLSERRAVQVQPHAASHVRALVGLGALVAVEGPASNSPAAKRALAGVIPPLDSLGAFTPGPP